MKPLYTPFVVFIFFACNLYAQQDTCKPADKPKTCDFVWTLDTSQGPNNSKFEPVDGLGIVGPQSGVYYEWTFDTSSYTGSPGYWSFNSAGPYKITMCAIVATNLCSCCVTKMITFPFLGTNKKSTLEFMLLPNPANSAIRIKWQAGVSSSAAITVYDAGYRKILQSEARNEEEIDLQTLSEGLYFVHIRIGDISKTLPFQVVH